MRKVTTVPRSPRDLRAISHAELSGEMPSRSLGDRGDCGRCLDAPALALSVRSVRRRCPERLGSSRTDEAVENGVLRRMAHFQPSHASPRRVPCGGRKKSLAMSKSASDPFDRFNCGCGTRLGSSPDLRGAPGAPISMLLSTPRGAPGQRGVTRPAPIKSHHLRRRAVPHAPVAQR